MNTVVPEQAVVPASAPTDPQPRLVPALVDGRQIWIECPDWCVLDHVAANDRFLEDVYHSGEMIDLEVPRFNVDPMLLAFVRLGLDSFGSKPELKVPFLVLEDGAGTGEGAYMRPEQAAEFADGLETFARQVRALARSISGTEAAS